MSDDDRRSNRAPDQEAANADMHAKIIILGDPGVGKTSIIRRFGKGTFEPDLNKETWDSLDQVSKVMTCSNGRTVELIVLDTAGQERFRTLTASFYRGARIVLLVFSLIDQLSFDHIDGWLEDLKRYSGPVGIILAGNKSDLTDKRVVNQQEAVAKVDRVDNIVAYFETSALSNNNITEMFLKASETIAGEGSIDYDDDDHKKNGNVRPRRDTVTLREGDGGANGKKKCCK